MRMSWRHSDDAIVVLVLLFGKTLNDIDIKAKIITDCNPNELGGASTFSAFYKR